jgi:small-conductance mechanosensitive channel
MWIERLARFGYVTKGFVYALIGILAVMAALTPGGETTDTEGALQTIATQPFGRLILILIAVGLMGYTLWRIVQAINDPEHQGADFKGLIQRFGYLISGVIYGGLAWTALQLAMGESSSGGRSKQGWTAQILAQPFGRWMIGTVGAIIIGMGCYRLYKAYHTKFRKRLDLRELNITQEKLVVNISRIGIAARGIVFILTGFFLIQAARQFDPNEVRGLDGILQTLAQQPFGKVLLCLVALGLIAYGIYMGVQARYRRINPESNTRQVISS